MIVLDNSLLLYFFVLVSDHCKKYTAPDHCKKYTVKSTVSCLKLSGANLIQISLLFESRNYTYPINFFRHSNI